MTGQRASRPRLTLREAAVGIVRTLRDAGHEAYFAGGCVRDALLGLTPKDYDIATDATPEQVRKLLPRSRYVGEAFGVVLVSVQRYAIEVATFRSEWGYSDKRRPDHVIFTDAQHDAQRRDFTINGLFADPGSPGSTPGSGPTIPGGDTSGGDTPRLASGEGDRIIDYVGGQADLKARVVRAIGDPSERFGEDYLRMLRAVRFASRLGFTLDPATAAAIRPLAKYLGQISRERIGQEIARMLDGPTRAAAAELVQTLGLDGPTLNEDHRAVALPTLARLAPEADYPTALAAWLIDRHAAAPSVETVAQLVQSTGRSLVARWRTALALSNQQRDGLAGVLRLIERAAVWPNLPMAQHKRLPAHPLWPQAWRVLAALQSPAFVEQLQAEAAPLLAEGVAPPPLVTGDDLIQQLGLTPGPSFGRLLEQVYDAQLEGKVTTKEEALNWLRETLDPSP